MKFTRHAKRRFAQRFPGLDPRDQWLGARLNRASGKILTQIRRQCPRHRYLASGIFRGCYYKLNKSSGIVFVVVPPETIITVFALITPAK